MANTSEVAAKAAVPSGSDIERAAAFAREDLLLEGEGPEALAPGTARRRALDAALAELHAGREEPSIEWRRRFSLLLGLERLLADETPKLMDGAELSAHQVDALSGTLAELIAEAQSADGRRNGEGPSSRAATRGAEPETEEQGANGEGAAEALDIEEEPQDFVDEPDEDAVAEAPEDPGAARRFWFEHARPSPRSASSRHRERAGC
jgi:ribonuclease E